MIINCMIMGVGECGM